MAILPADKSETLKIEAKPLPRLRLRVATQEEAERIDELAHKFEEMCRAAGKEVTPDGRIGAAVAAGLVGFSLKGFRNLRSKEGRNAGPPFYRLKVGQAKISYRIRDLAVWFESKREE